MRFNHIALRSFRILLLLFFIAFHHLPGGYGQASQGRIKGYVFNPENQPTEYSTVVLMNKDSVFMKGTLTAGDGSFLFDKLEAAKYFIMVRNVEFNTYISGPVNLAAGEEVNFDHIQLETRVTDLEEVEVKAQKPLYVQKIDRLEVNVESSATMAGDNGLEILEKSPGVFVDRQNNSISMRGKGGVTVLINGKLTHMPMTALFGMLEGMSASNIEKLELITTPPANLDAEGEGGYINIVLKKNENEGVTGMVSATAGYGRRERALAGGNFSYRKTKFDLYADYNFNYTNQIQYGYSDRIIMDPSYTFHSPSNTFRDTYQHMHNARMGIDFYVTPKTVIGILGTYYNRVFTQESEVEALYEVDPGPDSSSVGTIGERHTPSQYLVNLNLQHTFNEKNKINVDFDHFSQDDLQPTSYSTTYLDEMSQVLSQEEITIGKHTPLNIWVGKADYTFTSGENLTLETGVKGDYSFFTNEVNFESLVDDQWVNDPEFSEDASMSESVQAAYLSFTLKLDEKTNMKTGLRYERTVTHLSLQSDENGIDREFNDFFPTLFLSRQFNENNSLALSYNRRISRPGFFDLAPFVIFIDPLTYITGNVSLLPAISSSFKSDYTFRKLLVSLQYTRVNNSIKRFQPSRATDSDRGLLSSVNLDLEEIYSLSVSLPVNITKWWRMQNNLNGYYDKIDSDYPGGHLTINQANYDFNTSHTFMLPLDFSIDLSFFYYSKFQAGVWLNNPREFLNAGLQKKFRNDWGTLTLNVSNILNTPFFDRKAVLPEMNLEQNLVLDFDTRVVKLTWNKPFGNKEVKSRSKRQSGAQDVLQRVGN